jgi:hypothetical protein
VAFLVLFIPRQSGEVSRPRCCRLHPHQCVRPVDSNFYSNYPPPSHGTEETKCEIRMALMCQNGDNYWEDVQKLLHPPFGGLHPVLLLPSILPRVARNSGKKQGPLRTALDPKTGNDFPHVFKNVTAIMQNDRFPSSPSSPTPSASARPGTGPLVICSLWPTTRQLRCFWRRACRTKG